MSASVCAMPAPENTETADEFYGQTGIVLYEDDGIDYDAPDYGVKVISTGFEEMTAGKAVDTTFFNNAGVEIRTQGDGIAANFTDKEIGGITGNKIEGVIAENADKYACVRFFLLPKDSEITYGAGKYYIFPTFILTETAPKTVPFRLIFTEKTGRLRLRQALILQTRQFLRAIQISGIRLNSLSMFRTESLPTSVHI